MEDRNNIIPKTEIKAKTPNEDGECPPCENNLAESLAEEVTKDRDCGAKQDQSNAINGEENGNEFSEKEATGDNFGSRNLEAAVGLLPNKLLENFVLPTSARVNPVVGSYLEKLSPTALKGYQKRFFRLNLTDNALLYWREEPTFPDQQPTGCINLSAVVAIHIEDALNFVIKTHGRDYCLKALSPGDKDIWLESICMVVNTVAHRETLRDASNHYDFSKALIDNVGGIQTFLSEALKVQRKVKWAREDRTPLTFSHRGKKLFLTLKDIQNPLARFWFDCAFSVRYLAQSAVSLRSCGVGGLEQSLGKVGTGNPFGVSSLGSLFQSPVPVLAPTQSQNPTANAAQAQYQTPAASLAPSPSGSHSSAPFPRTLQLGGLRVRSSSFCTSFTSSEESLGVGAARRTAPSFHGTFRGQRLRINKNAIGAELGMARGAAKGSRETENCCGNPSSTLAGSGQYYHNHNYHNISNSRIQVPANAGVLKYQLPDSMRYSEPGVSGFRRMRSHLDNVLFGTIYVEIGPLPSLECIAQSLYGSPNLEGSHSSSSSSSSSSQNPPLVSLQKYFALLISSRPIANNEASRPAGGGASSLTFAGKPFNFASPASLEGSGSPGAPAGGFGGFEAGLPFDLQLDCLYLFSPEYDDSPPLFVIELDNIQLSSKIREVQSGFQFRLQVPLDNILVSSVGSDGAQSREECRPDNSETGTHSAPASSAEKAAELREPSSSTEAAPAQVEPGSVVNADSGQKAASGSSPPPGDSVPAVTAEEPAPPAAGSAGLAGGPALSLEPDAPAGGDAVVQGAGNGTGARRCPVSYFPVTALVRNLSLLPGEAALQSHSRSCHAELAHSLSVLVAALGGMNPSGGGNQPQPPHGDALCALSTEKTPIRIISIFGPDSEIWREALIASCRARHAAKEHRLRTLHDELRAFDGVPRELAEESVSRLFYWTLQYISGPAGRVGSDRVFPVVGLGSDGRSRYAGEGGGTCSQRLAAQVAASFASVPMLRIVQGLEAFSSTARDLMQASVRAMSNPRIDVLRFISDKYLSPMLVLLKECLERRDDLVSELDILLVLEFLVDLRITYESSGIFDSRFKYLMLQFSTLYMEKVIRPYHKGIFRHIQEMCHLSKTFRDKESGTLHISLFSEAFSQFNSMVSLFSSLRLYHYSAEVRSMLFMMIQHALLQYQLMLRDVVLYNLCSLTELDPGSLSFFFQGPGFSGRYCCCGGGGGGGGGGPLLGESLLGSRDCSAREVGGAVDYSRINISPEVVCGLLNGIEFCIYKCDELDLQLERWTPFVIYKFENEYFRDSDLSGVGAGVGGGCGGGVRFNQTVEVDSGAIGGLGGAGGGGGAAGGSVVDPAGGAKATTSGAGANAASASTEALGGAAAAAGEGGAAGGSPDSGVVASGGSAAGQALSSGAGNGNPSFANLSPSPSMVSLGNTGMVGNTSNNSNGSIGGSAGAAGGVSQQAPTMAILEQCDKLGEVDAYSSRNLREEARRFSLLFHISKIYLTIKTCKEWCRRIQTHFVAALSAKCERETEEGRRDWMKHVLSLDMDNLLKEALRPQLRVLKISLKKSLFSMVSRLVLEYIIRVYIESLLLFAFNYSSVGAEPDKAGEGGEAEERREAEGAEEDPVSDPSTTSDDVGLISAKLLEDWDVIGHFFQGCMSEEVIRECLIILADLHDILTSQKLTMYEKCLEFQDKYHVFDLSFFIKAVCILRLETDHHGTMALEADLSSNAGGNGSSGGSGRFNNSHSLDLDGGGHALGVSPEAAGNAESSSGAAANGSCSLASIGALLDSGRFSSVSWTRDGLYSCIKQMNVVRSVSNSIIQGNSGLSPSHEGRLKRISSVIGSEELSNCAFLLGPNVPSAIGLCEGSSSSSDASGNGPGAGTTGAAGAAAAAAGGPGASAASSASGAGGAAASGAGTASPVIAGSGSGSGSGSASGSGTGSASASASASVSGTGSGAGVPGPSVPVGVAAAPAATGAGAAGSNAGSASLVSSSTSSGTSSSSSSSGGAGASAAASSSSSAATKRSFSMEFLSQVLSEETAEKSVIAAFLLGRISSHSPISTLSLACSNRAAAEGTGSILQGLLEREERWWECIYGYYSQVYIPTCLFGMISCNIAAEDHKGEEPEAASGGGQLAIKRYRKYTHLSRILTHTLYGKYISDSWSYLRPSITESNALGYLLGSMLGKPRPELGANRGTGDYSGDSSSAGPGGCVCGGGGGNGTGWSAILQSYPPGAQNNVHFRYSSNNGLEECSKEWQSGYMLIEDFSVYIYDSIFRFKLLDTLWIRPSQDGERITSICMDPQDLSRTGFIIFWGERESSEGSSGNPGHVGGGGASLTRSASNLSPVQFQNTTNLSVSGGSGGSGTFSGSLGSGLESQQQQTQHSPSQYCTDVKNCSLRVRAPSPQLAASWVSEIDFLIQKSRMNWGASYIEGLERKRVCQNIRVKFH
ncbi:Pleckstriny domain containing protein [Cryptosporidium felis]|nr:Pleckstriny domain containing protein [Cryptosporidium felis]